MKRETFERLKKGFYIATFFIVVAVFAMAVVFTGLRSELNTCIENFNIVKTKYDELYFGKYINATYVESLPDGKLELTQEEIDKLIMIVINDTEDE